MPLPEEATDAYADAYVPAPTYLSLAGRGLVV